MGHVQLFWVGWPLHLICTSGPAECTSLDSLRWQGGLFYRLRGHVRACEQVLFHLQGPRTGGGPSKIKIHDFMDCAAWWKHGFAWPAWLPQLHWSNQWLNPCRYQLVRWSEPSGRRSEPCILMWPCKISRNWWFFKIAHMHSCSPLISFSR